MRESFPLKKPGDRLEASHVNALSAVARRLSNGRRGSYTSGHSGEFELGSGLSPFIQSIVRVKEQLQDVFHYKVQIRYFDSATNSWANSTEEYTLDSSEMDVTFAVGDKVIAFYHEQSGLYIPVGGSSRPMLRVGRTNEPIGFGELTGMIRIWENGGETEEDLEVTHDWITNGELLPTGTEVIVGWFSLERIWRIIGAEC